eukprot:TRINITY_DN5144_c0_g1_i1.p1 TRINITY_DN5144_c0_g1~~TRINITY_DN5144_c0_g1_i1.p1  ORF type:complete len:322 (-),score=79.23 TRINITY_DN5144_c0_g1_i1:50-1015(-)
MLKRARTRENDQNEDNEQLELRVEQRQERKKRKPVKNEKVQMTLMAYRFERQSRLDPGFTATTDFHDLVFEEQEEEEEGEYEIDQDEDIHDLEEIEEIEDAATLESSSKVKTLVDFNILRPSSSQSLFGKQEQPLHIKYNLYHQNPRIKSSRSSMVSSLFSLNYEGVRSNGLKKRGIVGQIDLLNRQQMLLSIVKPRREQLAQLRNGNPTSSSAFVSFDHTGELLLCSDQFGHSVFNFEEFLDEYGHRGFDPNDLVEGEADDGTVLHSRFYHSGMANGLGEEHVAAPDALMHLKAKDGNYNQVIWNSFASAEIACSNKFTP